MTTATEQGRGIYRRPPLYAKQEAALFGPERYSIVEASTKSGKTVGCIAWLIEQALAGRPGWNYWWVAPIYGQARIAYRRLKRGLTLPPDLVKTSDSELTIILPNETVIWFKGADNPDALYGEDVYAAVIDEATRVKEEAFYAIRSTLTATRGPLRVIGNVQGRKNWAYQMARRAESGAPGMAYHKLTAHDAVAAGILTADEVEDARRALPDDVFRQLYLAEPSDDGGNPFGLAAIQVCIGPLSTAPPLVWGWDLAKSVDWTAGVALDREGVTCRLERFQRPWQETIAAIRQATGQTRAIVDSTGVGDPVLEALQRAGSGGNFEGFKFSAPSKQQLMEGLAVAIQQRRVCFPDGPIVLELESFEYEYTRTGVRYSAPEGVHDDCVVALALAVSGSHESPPAAMAVEREPALARERFGMWGRRE